MSEPTMEVGCPHGAWGIVHPCPDCGTPRHLSPSQHVTDRFLAEVVALSVSEARSGEHELEAIRQRVASATDVAPFPPAVGWPDSFPIAKADRRTLLRLLDEARAMVPCPFSGLARRTEAEATTAEREKLAADEIRERAERLWQYVEHKSDCLAWGPARDQLPDDHPDRCTCGLVAIIAEEDARAALSDPVPTGEQSDE